MSEESATEIPCVGGPLNGVVLRCSAGLRPPPYHVVRSPVQMLNSVFGGERPAEPHYELVNVEDGYEYRWIQSAAEEGRRG